MTTMTTMINGMEEHLKNWRSLCSFVRVANEEDCNILLEMERGGKARSEFIRRIHCRINRLRAERERRALGVRQK